MFCRICGTPLVEGSAFCTACGTAVVLPPGHPPADEVPSEERAPVSEAAAEPSVPDMPAEEEPSKPHLKMNMDAPENAPASVPEENDTEEESAASDEDSILSDVSAIIVEVPVIVVTEPAKPTSARPAPGAEYFSAAGSLADGEPTPIPRPKAAAPVMSAALRASAPAAAMPPETGGYVDKISDHRSVAAPAPGVMMYEDNPYAYSAPAHPMPGYDATASQKRNLLLWIIVGILALGLIAIICVILFVPDVHNVVFGEPAVMISDQTLTLTVGDKVDLNDQLTLDHVDGNKIGWKSSDPEVATVRDGKIAAVAPGTCEITVYSKRDEEVSDTIQVTVTAVEDASGEETV